MWLDEVKSIARKAAGFGQRGGGAFARYRGRWPPQALVAIAHGHVDETQFGHCWPCKEAGKAGVHAARRKAGIGHDAAVQRRRGGQPVDRQVDKASASGPPLRFACGAMNDQLAHQRS
jgi:hypothetical protein